MNAELYSFAVQARGAFALAEGSEEPFGPVLERNRAIFHRYAHEISALVEQGQLASDLVAIQRRHQELVLELTLDGGRQFHLAALTLALHDCGEEGNPFACAYVEEKNRQMGITDYESTRAADRSTSFSLPPDHLDISATPARSLVSNEMLVHLGRGAVYLRDNVRGMRQQEKDLLTQLAQISDRISGLPSEASPEQLWIQAAEIFVQLTAGARMLLDEGMERDTGITAEAMFHVKLQEHGRAMPLQIRGQSAGCPCVGFVLALPLLVGIFSALVITLNII